MKIYSKSGLFTVCCIKKSRHSLQSKVSTLRSFFIPEKYLPWRVYKIDNVALMSTKYLFFFFLNYCLNVVWSENSENKNFSFLYKKNQKLHFNKLWKNSNFPIGSFDKNDENLISKKSIFLFMEVDTWKFYFQQSKSEFYYLFSVVFQQKLI